MLHEIRLETKAHDQMIDITIKVQELLDDGKVKEGLAVVHSSHTTAGITINENADLDVRRDFLRRLKELYPWDDPKDLHYEGNTAAHLKASTIGASQTVIIHNGKLLLGQWQGIYFCEFDGPRKRTCLVKILKES